ncbi:phosphoadenosine phosphosulfate reductase family protein [Paenibacillus sp. P22]|uniref:phosphoadenosine phosphosulfate reductase domain-containing protein n=1 Tax=Paenibacillus sp. P22 TaxID=483908 RepID=UPI000431E53C|nr:phosphoadenosine phosphosulfate reductase family protein [Paenibacillus sp. P22]CDN44014.1 Putative phage protein [Paenibacillus sp. P22]
MKNHIIFFSGGKASLAVADWVQEQHPDDNIVLYFTDVLWENDDLYRFINEATDKLQLPLLIHSAGINPIQLMFEKKMLYNSMIGDCSKILKQRVSANFLKRGKKPEHEEWRNRQYLRAEDFITDATLYFGIGFDEMHRAPAIIKNWAPFPVEMPLIDHNIWKDDVLKKYSIRQPVLYDYGFSHNNCNGRCVKAGQGHYKLLKDRMPDVFQKIMEQEHYLKICVSAYRYITDDKVPEDERIPDDIRETMLQELDDAFRDYFYDRAAKPKKYIHPAGSAAARYMEIKQYSFMKRDSKPYPIRDLHYEVEDDQQIDLFDIGGCGCFLEPYEPTA